jgi:hypothetical protein
VTEGLGETLVTPTAATGRSGPVRQCCSPLRKAFMPAPQFAEKTVVGHVAAYLEASTFAKTEVPA